MSEYQKRFGENKDTMQSDPIYQQGHTVKDLGRLKSNEDGFWGASLTSK
jgi:hypothetical protein